MRSLNPATGQLLCEYPGHDAGEVEGRIAQARQAAAVWKETSFPHRASLLQGVAHRLRQKRQHLATLMTQEMGKPISQSQGEVEKCAWVCEFYAENAESFLAYEPVETDAAQSGIRYDPLGIILAVMPWNFPFWQVFRCAAPAIMAGNVVLLKHASNVPGCALAIEQIWREAQLPEGVLTTLLIGSEQVAQVIANPAVRAVSLTGSEQAGRSIAEAAGRELKKCVLELGGSDPFLVLADADLEVVVEQAVAARCINSGQSCVAAKRFLVDASLVDEFQRRMAERMQAQRVGDPLLPETQIGPLARKDLLETVERQVEESVREGARLLAGGKRLGGAGYFFAPTVLADVHPECTAFQEEVFGPVAAVTPVRDLDHAIELANRSRYGLGASVWTRDTSQAQHLAARLESGLVFVNQIVKSDPRLPFGGVKRSGFGRELAQVGIREMVNVKTVWVE